MIKYKIINIMVFSEKKDVHQPLNPFYDGKLNSNPAVTLKMLCIPSNLMNSLFFPYDIYANLVGFHTLVPVIHVVITSRKDIFKQTLLKSANRFMRYAGKRFFVFFLNSAI